MSAFSGFGHIRRALENRNYRIFTYGNVVSHIGTWVQRVAIYWLTWELTHSGLWLGIMSFADLIPTILLAPFTGAVADRVDRLRMMKLTQSLNLAQAVTLATLTLTGLITIEWLLVLTAIGGVIVAFNQPVRLAIVPSMVDRKDLSAAIGINSLTFNMARFLGPMIAGWIIDFVSVGAAFVLNAVTFLGFIFALSLLRLSVAGPVKSRTPARAIPREIMEGYSYAARHEGIGRMLIVLVFVAVFARPYIDLLPGFADEVFGRGVQGFSWLMSMTGVGAMLGGLWLAQRGAVQGLTAVSINAALIMALALIAFTATEIFWFALPCLVIAGFGMIVTGVGEQTLIQNAVDPAIRGRVMGLYGMIGRGAPALGGLLIGGLSELVGFRWPVMGAAVVVLLMWVWARRRQDDMARALEGEPDSSEAR